MKAKKVAALAFLGVALIAVSLVPRSGIAERRFQIHTFFLEDGPPPPPDAIAACQDDLYRLHSWTVPVGGAAESYHVNLGDLDYESLGGADVALADVDLGFATWNEEHNDCFPARPDLSNFAFTRLGTTTRLPSLWTTLHGDGFNDVAFLTPSEHPLIGYNGSAIAAVRFLTDSGVESGEPSSGSIVLEFDLVVHATYGIWGSTERIGERDIWNVVAP